MCDNLLELAQRVQLLKESSVMHFSFSLTILLTTFFMLFYRMVASNKSIIKLLLYGSFFFYGINVIRLVFFPFPFNSEYIALLKQQIECGVLIPSRHNLELFDYMKWDNLFHITTVGNFILLMPLSLYLPIIFSNKKWNIFKITTIGFGISLSIELIQLTYSLMINYIYRSFDVDDLMLNTLGITIGYLIYVIIKAIIVGIQKLSLLVFKVKEW